MESGQMKKLARFSHAAHPRFVTLLATATILSACAVGPDFARPVANTSSHYDKQAEQLSGDQRFEMGQLI
jgi:hypothetical protein